MADKPKLKYQVVQGTKPGTTDVVLRPQIVERETYANEMIVEYALDNSYVRGKYEDVLANWYGLIQTAKDLVDSGYDVNFGDWFRVHMELTGAVQEDGALTSANSLMVRITPLNKMKQPISIENFTFVNVDDTGLIVKIDNVLSPDGENGEWIKSKKLLLTGKNLQVLNGDGVTVYPGATATGISLTVEESDYAHCLCSWNSALDNTAAGTVVTVVFKGHAGLAGGASQTSKKDVTLVA